MKDDRFARQTTHVGYRIDLPSVVNRPSSVWPWLALLLIVLIAPWCVGLTALGAQRLDLFNATLFDSCAIHAYQIHWQDARRYPERFRYDFTTSPVSFVLIEIWVEDGPTITLSRDLPIPCRLPSAAHPAPLR